MIIIIDPRLKYNYSSWYLLGIKKILGNQSIKYDVAPFKELEYTSGKLLNAGMAFIVEDKNEKKKIFIDFEDKEVIAKDRYNWCDIYGKINSAFDIQKQYPKVLPIGPSFGLQIDQKWKIPFLALKNYLKGRDYSKIPFKIVLRDY